MVTITRQRSSWSLFSWLPFWLGRRAASPSSKLNPPRVRATSSATPPESATTRVTSNQRSRGFSVAKAIMPNAPANTRPAAATTRAHSTSVFLVWRSRSPSRSAPFSEDSAPIAAGRLPTVRSSQQAPTANPITRPIGASHIPSPTNPPMAPPTTVPNQRNRPVAIDLPSACPAIAPNRAKPAIQRPSTPTLRNAAKNTLQSTTSHSRLHSVN